MSVIPVTLASRTHRRHQSAVWHSLWSYGLRSAEYSTCLEVHHDNHRRPAVPLQYEHVASFQPCFTVLWQAKENPTEFVSAGHSVMTSFLVNLSSCIHLLQKRHPLGVRIPAATDNAFRHMPLAGGSGNVGTWRFYTIQRLFWLENASGAPPEPPNKGL